MKNRPGILILTLLVAIVLGAGPALAKTIHEKVTVKPVKTISPAEESIISSAAAKVLRYIAKARGAIHDKDLEQAGKDLKKANKLIDIIKASLPTTKVKDHIWVAKKHLNYESTEDVKPDLVPIYAALDEIEDVVPVKQAKKHLDKAKESLDKGDKKTAKESLEAVDKALIYTEVDLPLASTEKHIIAAQGMLAQNKPDDANKELKAAEDGVLFISTVTEAPITLAKKSLWKATRDYAAGKYDAAGEELEKAGVYLKNATKSADKTTREEAGKLGDDIEALKAKVGKGGKATGTAITSLWERSRALSEREAERISTGRQKLRSGSKVKTDLIEAKLHLAYAETYQFITGNADKAGAEIDKAQDYLKSASENADSKVKAKINAVEKKLDKAKKELHNKKEATKIRYEMIKGDLRKFIKDL